MEQAWQTNTCVKQVIEEKERELVDCIAQNYSKLKGKLLHWDSGQIKLMSSVTSYLL